MDVRPKFLTLGGEEPKDMDAHTHTCVILYENMSYIVYFSRMYLHTHTHIHTVNILYSYIYISDSETRSTSRSIVLSTNFTFPHLHHFCTNQYGAEVMSWGVFPRRSSCRDAPLPKCRKRKRWWKPMAAVTKLHLQSMHQLEDMLYQMCRFWSKDVYCIQN